MKKNDYINLLSSGVDHILHDGVLTDAALDFMREFSVPMRTMMAYYNCAIMRIETKFKVLNEQLSVEYDRNPIESIKSRLKSAESIVRKLKEKELSITTDSVENNIFDVAGIRIICSFIDDIYSLADSFISQDDITVITRKDYIANPKPNGYRSLHLIVEVPIFLQNGKKVMKAEVQLRTIAMDFWASLDHKLSYKKNIPSDEIETLKRQLAECADTSAMLDRRMQEIKNRLLS